MNEKQMSNKTYDLLKYIAEIVLPALATLVVSVFGIWNIPYGEAIGATIMAIDLFLGVILKLEHIKYYKTHEVIDSGFDGEVEG